MLFFSYKAFQQISFLYNIIYDRNVVINLKMEHQKQTVKL